MAAQLTDPLTATVAAPSRRGGPPSPLVVLSLGVLAVVAFTAITGDLLAPQSPTDQNPLLSARPPGGEHLLGTDQLGRDIASRVVSGARDALVGPLAVAVLTTLIGLLLGLTAGYAGGWIDAVIARTADLLYSLPALLIAIVVVGLVSPSYLVTIGVLTFLSFPGDVRVFRSVTMVEARLPYVDAARTLGLPAPVILLRHVLPNILPTLVSTFLIEFASALVGFSALAFLGLGVQAGGADWGTMLADGQSLLFVNPAMSMTPAVLLILVAAAATITGDWLFDRFSRRADR